MEVLQKYQNKKIAIYGMGSTGCSVAKTFIKLNTKLFCWDDNSKTRNNIKKLKYNVDKFWIKKEQIDFIVISPGIDINKCKIKNYLKKNINKIITDIDIFFELNKNATIISITGTNGKSTTCKIIEKILKTANFNVKTVGNIGFPILSLKKTRKKSIFILEVSSYQLQYSKLFRSKHAAILNISPDHLERHNNIINYTKIKSKIFFAQTHSDFTYINSRNKYSKLIRSVFKKNEVKSKLTSINIKDSKFLLKKINNNYFKSKGGIENLAFAYKIVKSFKVNDKLIIKALNSFKTLPHRQETIISNNRLLCINDSKATSFDASYQSLSNYNNIYWILGGLPKYKDNFFLKTVKKKIVRAYLIGKSTTFFEKKIKGYIQYKISYNLKKAINHVYKDLKNSQENKNLKKTILLSPAAASFDQFKNFESRGNYFRFLIKKYFIKIK